MMGFLDRLTAVRLLVSIGTLMCCATALAAEPATSTAPAGDATTQTAPSDARPARTGFQMAFRTGLKFPFGEATGRQGDGFARRYAFQWPLVFDLGAKLHESIYLGGYFGLGFGSEGDDSRIEAYCDDNDDNFQNEVSCSVLSIELGLRAQYHFRPGKPINPYVGYGIGFAAVHQAIKDQGNGYSEESRSSGIDYAKLEFGVDFRKAVGFGPFLELTAGRFTREVSEVNGDETFRGSIDRGAWHYWLMVGGRLVVFP